MRTTLIVVPPPLIDLGPGVGGRIVGGGAYETEPAGAAGLAVLVKAHPPLQGQLIDFLETMPAARLGPWACAGWGAAIKDADAGQRFDRLVGSWSKDGGQMLKAAATSTLSITVANLHGV